MSNQDQTKHSLALAFICGPTDCFKDHENQYDDYACDDENDQSYRYYYSLHVVIYKTL